MNLTGSLTVVTTGTEFQVTSTGVRIGNVIGDAHSITGSVGISGSLSGSSANFSGNVTIKGNTNQQLILDYTTASGGFTWQTFAISGVNKYRIFGNTDNSFILYSDVLASNVLSIASTGAATFSSSVTAANFVSSNSTNGFNIDLSKSDGFGALIQLKNTSSLSNELIRVLNSSNTIISQIYPATNGIAITTGNVGIGTSSLGNFDGVSFTGPFFDVAGMMQIKGTSANTIAGLQFGGTTYRKALIYSTIGTEDPALIFATAAIGSSSSAAERMRITSVGEILAGSTSAGTGYVAVNKIGSFQGYTTDSNSTAISAVRTAGFFGVDGGASSNNQASYTALTANVQWGAANNPGAIFRGYQNTTLAIQISFSGNIANTNGSYGTLASDIRLKENIKQSSSKLNDLLKLNVVNFNFIGKEQKHIGFIAQELKEVFPSFVYQTDTREFDEQGNVISGLEDTLGTKVGMEFAILVKAIQELQAQITELKNK
jgi:hypothetical protein